MPKRHRDAEITRARGRLCECVQHWKYMLTIMDDPTKYGAPGDKAKLENAVKQTGAWVRDNYKNATAAEFEAKMKEFEDLAEEILDNHNLEAFAMTPEQEKEFFENFYAATQLFGAGSGSGGASGSGEQ